MANPMTAQGDMITGGAAGAPARLIVGSEGDALTVLGGEPAWAPLSIPALSDATPQPLGVAAEGTSSEASRADHVHASNTPSELTVPGLVSLAGSVVSYSASPSGVTQERGDTALAARNGIRFWGRGNAKGAIEGTATGLRITTSATDTTQPYPFADGGTSIFVALPTLNEFEVDLYYTLVLTQKATGGDSVNFRAGLMGFLIGQSYNCGRIALFSFGGVNSGNPTEEWGFSSAVNSTQASTTTTTNRVARMRRAGNIFEVWGGPDINNLTRRIAQASNANSQTPLLLTAGVNANGASMVGSYVELTSIAIRDRWS
jgi:hypothetical protein